MRALVLWIGLDPMPQWRLDCVASIKRFHPDIELDVVHDRRVSDRPQIESDMERFRYCSEGENRLWIDSDIELLAPLPLGDNPALAYETFPHHSICWSGRMPVIFSNPLNLGEIFIRFRIAKQMGDSCDYIYPRGLYRHWATGANGERVPRLVMGYKQSDFEDVK